MFNIYKFTKDKGCYKSHLNLLRLDTTELDIYKERFVNDKHTTVSKREYGSKIKKIGFLSDDFREIRPSGQLSVTFFEYLKNYNNYFEIYFYTNSKNFVSNRFSTFAIVRKHKKNNILIDMIKDDNIDILFDMQGHMHNNYNQLLNEKIAPIMCHWLGYPGTIGIPTFDYIFADPIIIPEDSRIFYREKIAYFPECYQPNNHELIISDNTIERKTYDIPENKFVFCHFNSDYKLDKKMWLVFLEILKQSPNSVLVFKTKSERCSFANHLLKLGEKYGVINQLIHTKRLVIYEHVKRLSVCDLGLDLFRLNGHTTSSDLIEAGTPFITYSGNTYHNRVSKSLLCSIGLEELCVNSFDEYINLAVRLSKDKEYYANIKKTLLKNRTNILFNTQLYCNNFVKLISKMWKNNYNESLDKIWVYYDKLDSPGNTILKSEKRNKELIEFAEQQKCVAYNTDGELKHTVIDKKDWIKKETGGLWVYETCNDMTLTLFGNNHKDKKFNWVFYKDKNFKEHTYKQTDEKNQLLRDIAENDIDCLAFNLKGDLKSKVEPYENWIDDKGNGIWVRKEITLSENINIDNKGYNEPLVVVYHYIKNLQDDIDLANFLYDELYLNMAVVLIMDKDFLDKFITTVRRRIVGSMYLIDYTNNVNSAIKNIFGDDVKHIFKYKKNMNIKRLLTK